MLKIGALVTGICCFLFILLLHMDAMHLLHIQYIVLLLVYGLSLGLVTTPLTRVVLGTVPVKDQACLIQSCIWLIR
ncbi:hypothetical protein O0550_23750 [Brevibacillus halotolerans]|uniref:hypothetical protein n=1 Tax=Brevibacillus TaxID=55080 RepID=UPI00215D10C1|nr:MULTISPECIES: hypothetical protein [Brevibacillus]MCR8966161.1 hypothetical protein [Brevibacillus laterosporus]MCZ0838318.1 hypothetical protein [Brevibacillus halotolerans]